MASNTIHEFITDKWTELTKNARDGLKESVDEWNELTKHSKDGHLDDLDNNNPKILYLPYDFITPGGRFSVQFYWDSYFIILALLKTGKTALAKGMIENMFFLIEQNGYVIANRKRWAAGSQLPFLADMVFYYYCATNDIKWLESALPYIVKERNNYWCAKPHLAYEGLSRYHAPTTFPKDSWVPITLDNEATWDLSPRFDDDVLNLLPIDLNSNLWMYEKRIIHFLTVLNRSQGIEYWEEISKRRLNLINTFFWDEQDGFFYDYNFISTTRKRIKCLASYFTMYYEIASSYQAERMSANIELFETDHGLVTCDKDYGYTNRQWNYPIGWAPLQWIVCKGLWNYGYKLKAKKIAEKWNQLILREWKKTGKIFEKYDVVNGNSVVSEDPRYKNQTGFGWTNSVYLLLENEILN